MKKTYLSKLLLCLISLLMLNYATVTNADQSYYASEGQVKISEINPSEGWIKLYNTGDTSVDLAGWVFYDENDSHEFFITLPDITNDNGENKTLIAPETEVTISGKNDTDFMLNKEGGEVRLYSGPIEMEGELEDKIIYPIIREGESYRSISNDMSGKENDNTRLISTGEGQGEIGVESAIVSKDIKYQIPENNAQVNGVVLDNKNSNSKKEGRPSNKVTNTNSGGYLDPRFHGDDNTILKTEDSNAKAGSNPQSENSTFTASSGMEKSPYAWFYRLWNSWFLWRIILPFLGLWVVLYFIVCFARKKYLS